jgi:MEMO1 family protein
VNFVGPARCYNDENPIGAGIFIMLPERPQLRPYLEFADDPHDPNQVYLVDRLGLAEPFALSPAEIAWLDWLDGAHSLTEIHAEATRGQPAPIERVQQWLTRLEHGLLLESPRFHEVVHHPVRPPRCIGCYEGRADALRLQLRRLFTHPQGAGLPRPGRADGSLRAVLVPHIDYARGGLSYTHAFKEIVERSDASLFVIIGTSHHSAHRFTLTRKHFRTPLGIVPTDQEHIDRLVKHFGAGLFDDEWLAHFPEHSIELEVVLLQYLYENVRPIRIVPLVVGSFHDCVRAGTAPMTRADIAGMVDALKKAEEETPEPICYLISGDLAHIGPKFIQGQRLDDSLLRHSLHQDQVLLRHAEAIDMAGYFRVIAEEDDARNICGLPPTFAALAAICPSRGKLLHYDRYVHPHGYESVSFASMAFYR